LLGARVATLEYGQAAIPFGLVADASSGYLMANDEVDLVLVGAERIAANGDSASIAGTYPLAVLAQRHGLPFYVCALRTTFDPITPDGRGCPNADLPQHVLTTYRGARITEASVDVRAPWLDITPGDLVTAFITEDGVVA
jgi:methylthioribose-1-phosphate isomerase